MNNDFTFIEMLQNDGDYTAEGFVEGFCLSVQKGILLQKTYMIQLKLLETKLLNTV